MPVPKQETRRQFSTLIEPSLLSRLRTLAESQGHTPSSYIRSAIIDRVIRDEPETEAGVTVRVFLSGYETQAAAQAADAAGLPLQTWMQHLVAAETNEL